MRTETRKVVVIDANDKEDIISILDGLSKLKKHLELSNEEGDSIVNAAFNFLERIGTEL